MRHALEPGDLAHAARRPSKKSRRRIKKRHVERVTRLPTKRMATACWDFIVARTTPRETAPLLDFFSLRVTNKEISSTGYPQHDWPRSLRTWRTWRAIRGVPAEVPKTALRSRFPRRLCERLLTKLEAAIEWPARSTRLCAPAPATHPPLRDVKRPLVEVWHQGRPGRSTMNVAASPRRTSRETGFALSSLPTSDSNCLALPTSVLSTESTMSPSRMPAR